MVFFSSYSNLLYSVGNWEERGLMREIREYKDTFKESQVKAENENEIESYLYKIKQLRKGRDKHTGAMLFGVCRGNFSEGFDFSDHDARCVIIIGIPNANVTDARIILQKQYLDDKESTQGN